MDQMEIKSFPAVIIRKFLEREREREREKFIFRVVPE